MKCNRRFAVRELWISVLELLLKDDIQSGILFWVCTSQSSFKIHSRYFIAFSVCSVVAHLKLLICFVTKLCGLGAAEEGFCDDSSCAKRFACVIGFIGSLPFLVFTYLFTLVYI